MKLGIGCTASFAHIENKIGLILAQQEDLLGKLSHTKLTKKHSEKVAMGIENFSIYFHWVPMS